MSLLKSCQFTISENLAIHFNSNHKTQFCQTHNSSITVNNHPRISPLNNKIKAVMSTKSAAVDQSSNVTESMKNLLFVEMGVGYDQHGFVFFLNPVNFVIVMFKIWDGCILLMVEMQARYYQSRNASLPGCYFFQFYPCFS